MSRELCNPDEVWDSTEYMFNQVVVENGTLYASGQIGTDANNVVAGDDIESQARKAFENIGIILEEYDKDLSDITKIRSYMTDLHDHLPVFREVWRTHYGHLPQDERPCHTTIGVDKLSHIAEGELLIELEFWLELD